MSKEAEKQVKIALDECRTLMLGAQILFGFHLNAVFRNLFDSMPLVLRILYVIAFLAMTVVIALLIAPTMQHRLVERGRASGRILRETTQFAGLALLPFAFSLGIDVAIVIAFKFGMLPGSLIGFVTLASALTLWYGLEYLWREPDDGEDDAMPEEHHTPLDVRIDQMLTESRVLLPGAQALFGFQLVVLLTEPFDQLPEISKVVHTFALCAVTFSVMLLMAPAAFHRISFGGRNSERFVRIGSGFVIASAVPLAVGISADIYVAVSKALQTPVLGTAAAVAVAVMLAGLWFIQPLALRRRMSARHARTAA